MNFEIWHNLEKDDCNSQENDLNMLLGTTVKILESSVDNEGTYKAKIVINDLKELLEIPYLLSDNIVVYGANSDIIMTVKTMRELGLD
ncbi:hypothetical protein [Hathewaya massiliensis]|uniref:hypothetical protein n=1 Tax=Hathewaya massiliensis TaxID=1964382 RepID=UPI001158A88E|nr:hypothetical protein [Hathewaya massiliensis]